MEQILLSQLSSLKQVSFHLALRGNTKKIGQFRRELAEYLATNSITVDILEKEDNLLTGDKVQLASETIYSNSSRTIENIFTGGFNPIIFQYVLNHCKQKVLMGSSGPLPEATFKFKIEPFIRIESVISKNKSNNRISKVLRQDEDEELPSTTQRNSRKSNRNVKNSRKNQEDHSKDSINHEYHGRKCFCCSNRSNEDSELRDEFSIFTRMPKKSIAENKQNSNKKSFRVSEFQAINNRTSPQPLAHQLSVRGNSSQSDRHRKSPNLYFKNHLHTHANKKQGQDSNRFTATVGDNKMGKTETMNGFQSSKWIKTKRNDEPLSKTCQIDDDKSTQLKKGSKFATKIPRKNDKVFRSFKQRVFENKGDFSDEQSIKGNSNDSRQVGICQKAHQTMNNSSGNTKIQIQQRYSQMIAPNDHKIQLMGGYSIDQKSNKNICPGLQKIAHQSHQRNESLQSWFKNKKDLDPITKIKSTNEAKMKNQEETPIIVSKSTEKASSVNKPAPERQISMNIERSLNKNSQNCSSSNRLASNRIKKIPLTQKMQMIKQGQERVKNNIKKQISKAGSQENESIITVNKDRSSKILQNNAKGSIHKMNASKKSSSSSLQKLEKDRNAAIHPSRQSLIQGNTDQRQPASSIKQKTAKGKELFDHQDDNFSVTQERINNYPQNISQSNKNSNKSLPKKDAVVRPENDLASTIKEINYEEEETNKEMACSNELSLDPQAEDQKIETCRTIPMRNQSNEPLKYEEPNQIFAIDPLQEQEYHIEEKGQQQKEYFDNLFDKNEANIQISPAQEPKLPHQSSKRFNTCESRQIIDSKTSKQLITAETRPNPSTTSDILQESESLLHPQAYRSEPNDSQPSQYSSTTQLHFKQDQQSASNNRLSIDKELRSPLSARKSSISRNIEETNPTKSKDKLKTSSQRHVHDSNLEQFEKELFEESSKIDRNDSKEPLQGTKMNKVGGGGKDFLRLQTIDEVNESIYRQIQKKEMEQKLNSLSVSSEASNCKLKDSLFNSCSGAYSQREGRPNQIKKCDKIDEYSKMKGDALELQSQNQRDCCESKHIISIHDQFEQVSNQPKLQSHESRQKSNEIENRIDKFEDNMISASLQKSKEYKPSSSVQQDAVEQLQAQGEPVDKRSMKPFASDAQQENRSFQGNNFDTNQQPTRVEQAKTTSKSIKANVSIIEQPKINDQQEKYSQSVRQAKPIGQSTAKYSNSDDIINSQIAIKDDSAKGSANPQRIGNKKLEDCLAVVQTDFIPELTLSNRQSSVQDKLAVRQDKQVKPREELGVIAQGQLKQARPKATPKDIVGQTGLDKSGQCEANTSIKANKVKTSLLSQQEEQPNSLNTQEQQQSNGLKQGIQPASFNPAQRQISSQQVLQKQKPARIIKIAQNSQIEPINHDQNVNQRISNITDINQTINNEAQKCRAFEKQQGKLQNSHVSAQRQQQNHTNQIPFVCENRIQQPAIGKNQLNHYEGAVPERTEITETSNKVQLQRKMQEKQEHNVKESLANQPNIAKADQDNGQRKTERQKPQAIPHLISFTDKSSRSQGEKVMAVPSSTQPSQQALSGQQVSKTATAKDQLQAIKKQKENLIQVMAHSNLPSEARPQQYPSNPSNAPHLPLPQQKNIEVQTDYLLPSEQANPSERSVCHKSQSDHLSKKKCKINLCEPEIISTCNNFPSSHEIAAKQLKKKNRTEAFSHIGQGTALQEQYGSGEPKALATEPSHCFNGGTENNLQAGKHSSSSNIFDTSHHEDIRTSSREPAASLEGLQPKREDLRLQFRSSEEQPEGSHPEIINKLVYKNIPVVRAASPGGRERGRKAEVIAKALRFVERRLPGMLSAITNRERTEVCLFVNNQWMLFRSGSPISLPELLLSELREDSAYKCIEALTGMPMRILKDKEQDPSNRRLIKSLKALLDRRQEHEPFETVLYGLHRIAHEVVSLERVRYFLDSAKQSKTILECRRAEGGEEDEEACNFEGEAGSEFIQLFLLGNPQFLTVEADPSAVNTYELELSQLIFYVAGNYKFILYEETARNEYRLVKESHLWLKHKNGAALARFLLILEPLPQREGQHVVTLRLAAGPSEEGARTNRVVKYHCGGRTKGYQGGYENQKNLYLPLSKQLPSQ